MKGWKLRQITINSQLKIIVYFSEKWQVWTKFSRRLRNVSQKSTPQTVKFCTLIRYLKKKFNHNFNVWLAILKHKSENFQNYWHLSKSLTWQFVLTDDAGAIVKSWILDLKEVKLYEGTAEAEITLKMNQSTMISICTGAMESTAALNQDLIDVEGNLELLQLLKPFIGSL